MNGRVWYGISSHFKNKSKQDKLVNDLLKMYADAITQYFSVVDSYDYTSIERLDRSKLFKGDILFLDWFLEKGLPYLRSFAQLDLPDNEELISKIEYDMYILEEEMDFQYPEDIRSTLISIVNDMPDYIKAATEIAATEIIATVNIEKINGDWNNYTDEISYIINSSYLGFLKDYYRPMSKYEEPTKNVGSSFFYKFRREICEFIRVL